MHSALNAESDTKHTMHHRSENVFESNKIVRDSELIEQSRHCVEVRHIRIRF